MTSISPSSLPTDDVAAGRGAHDAARASARLSVEGVTTRFRRHNGAEFRAVDDVSFEVQQGELLVLLGPSGCGKSTLLRGIAGLESPTAGRISVAGVVVYDAGARIDKTPDQRDINMMFQSYALWPHMSVEDNVAYPLRMAGMGKQAARSRANEYLDLVGLGELGQQYPAMISGGQQQRVALARTLISEPAVVLFDEPLSNVDARVRVRLRALITRLHEQLGFAAVYVTHDQMEAMGLGTRVAVMRSGRIDQIDTPVTVYERPLNRSTAEFIGEAIFWPARVLGRDGNVLACELGFGERVLVPISAWWDGADPKPGDEVTVMVRPENCRIRPFRGDTTAGWRGTVSGVTFSGAMTEYRVQLKGETTRVWALGAPDAALRDGAEAVVELPEDAIRIVADD